MQHKNYVLSLVFFNYTKPVKKCNHPNNTLSKIDISINQVNARSGYINEYEKPSSPLNLLVHLLCLFGRYIKLLDQYFGCINHYEKPSSPLKRPAHSPCLYGFNNTATIRNEFNQKRGVLCR